MTYQIITLNEREKTRTIWGTFHYPSDNPERVINFLHYLKKSSSRPESFLVHELETDRVFGFLESLPIMEKKFSAQPSN